jgi:hypothetical protein
MVTMSQITKEAEARGLTRRELIAELLADLSPGLGVEIADINTEGTT